MSESNGLNPSRRAFLRGGALLMAFTLMPVTRRALADSEVDTLGTVVLAPIYPAACAPTLTSTPGFASAPTVSPCTPARLNWAPV